MLIRVVSDKEFEGFFLNEPFNFEGNLVLLTGKNGSGKTRLLKGLESGSISLEVDDIKIHKNAIKYIELGNVKPSLGFHYDKAFEYKVMVDTAKNYERFKSDFDKGVDSQIALDRQREMNGDDSLSYLDLFKVSKYIGGIINKLPSEITKDEFETYFFIPQKDVFGLRNLTKLFSDYINLKRKNEINKQLKIVKNGLVAFDDVNFENTFGIEPWVKINKILNYVFDGKFQCSIPNEDFSNDIYIEEVKLNDELRPIKLDQLSSGEKTLLWLSITLFNFECYDIKLTNFPKLVLFDEPDAFLHPKMVDKMYKVFESVQRVTSLSIIFTTHSPTTVALAPSDNVYLVEDNYIKGIDKDSAVTELLDGVNQIAIDPKNRRQVFVESNFDADFYTAIYNELKFLGKIDPSISLNFIPSGAKLPQETLKNKLKQVLNITDEDLVKRFIDAINGEGNCLQVIASVESLSSDGAKNVRGIIDYDNKNTTRHKNVSVLAKNYAYSIENLSLDPINIINLLHFKDDKKFPLEDICGEKVSFNDWLNNKELLQNSMDWYIEKVLGRESKQDDEIEYVSGLILKTDKEYLIHKGHPLEDKIVKEVFEGLKGYYSNNNQSTLKVNIAKKSMCKLAGEFIPKKFLDVILEVQK